MEEDTIPHDSAKNCNISVIEDERQKVKDFVYKHFREESLLSHSEESPVKEYGSSSKKDKQTLNKAHCKVQQGAVFSGKILSFGCSVCKDDSTYSPNDLLKHFRSAHQGTLPTYPCDLCGFVTNEFPALQRHRIEHRNTLVTCELCSDGVQYSLLLLTRHYIMCHSMNGHFHCDWCEFTTVDAGTFVQHIHHHNESPWKCSKCRHISLNEEDHQKHINAHTGTFPFTCQVCGYGAARSEQLKKHMTAVHKEKSLRGNVWKTTEDGSTPANSSSSVKLLLKKSFESQEAQRISRLNCLSGSLPNQNGRLIQPEISLEETHHFVDGIVAKKDNKNWSKGFHHAEQSTPVVLQEFDNCPISDAASHTNPNGLTVLMVKNKISLPPNCTTKVMGFKIVDGKKHLVLKVIPAAKQDACTQNHSSVEDMSYPAPNAALDKSKVFVENGECLDGKNSTSHCYAVSPRSGSGVKADDEIMAVKVKIEEEETSDCNLDPAMNEDDVDGEQQSNHSLSRSSTADTLYPITNEFELMGFQSYPSQTACSERSVSDNNSILATFNNDAVGLSGSKISSHVPGLSLSASVAHKKLLSNPLFKNVVKNCSSTDESSVADVVTEKLTDRHKGNSAINTEDNQSSPITPETADINRGEVTQKDEKQNCIKLTHVATPLESSSPTSCSRSEGATGSENVSQSSPNQDVFAFHNYSKETFSTSPNTTHNSDNMSELSAEKESVCESSQFSLTLAESPEPVAESENGDDSIQEKNLEDTAKLPESDIDTNTEELPNDDENPESVLQDFNIIKIEEENIPISSKQLETKSSSTSLGSVAAEHSDAIITQQFNKERIESSASSDSRQTKTTLRILQLPEGKQPVLLRTTENHFAMPMQVKSTPGFKLITNCENPQINVSYMKPRLERPANPAGVSFTPSNKRAGVSAPKAGNAEKGTTLLSAIQTGVGNTSNQHYLLNSPGLKGPVLLSSASHNSTDKATKTQPTCYLVQRSIPFLQAPSTPALRLANSQFPLNSRPVLAMPVSSADKTNTLQTGRQAFLLRYISPPKSSLLNNQESKTGTQSSQTSESTGNKVIFKIVAPTGSLLTSGAPTSNSQPLFLATRPQTQCFLVSSNQTNAKSSNTVKKMITVQNTAESDLKESSVSPSKLSVKVKPSETDKPILAPRPIRPPSQRKRRRKALFDELPTTVHKARRLTNKVLIEKERPVLWTPAAKEVERILRLAPFNSVQQIKCPRRYQPVVVLNHPDADIPEVANIMKVVNRYKGAVTKVSLSQKTIQVLSELSAQGKKSLTKGPLAQSSIPDPRPRPVQSSVRERFLLKLKLRKKSKKKYEVVKALPGCRPEPVVFDCWFCGRLFNSQEDWIGHGQRHLMEATRDWNKLF